jgi:beta-phosphoglucomutase-like phosphatase (HAD superfamily)
MPDFRGIIFDFDGVLLESELELNRLTAELLTEMGHATTLHDALAKFTGLNGRDVVEAIESHIGRSIPDGFHERMKEESARALRDGLAEVVGAVEFVRSLPRELPRAVASSSSTRWIRTHLEHLGLTDAFGDHIYSGREHVERGKPEPDLYLYAAKQIGVPIEQSVILEDSRVGVTGALASGARVIGLAAGSHCLDGHDEMLRKHGVQEIAYSFDDVRRLLNLG